MRKSGTDFALWHFNYRWVGYLIGLSYYFFTRLHQGIVNS